MSAAATDSADDNAGSNNESLSPSRGENISVVVDELSAGQRLDAFLAAAIPAVSRSRVRRGIDLHLATVDGVLQRASYRVTAGQRVEISLPPAAPGPQAEAISLAVLFEDDAIVVVNKPPGMVVHPAKGH